MPLSNGEHLQCSRTLNAVLMGRSQFRVNLTRPATFRLQNLALTRDGRTSGIAYRGPSGFVELTMISLGLRCTQGCGQGAAAPHPNTRQRRGGPVGWANFGPWWQPSSAAPTRSPTGFRNAMTRSNLPLCRAPARDLSIAPTSSAVRSSGPPWSDDRTDHRLELALRCSSRALPNNVSKCTKLDKKEDAIFSLCIVPFVSMPRIQIYLGEPSLYRKMLKPVGACSAHSIAGLLFPGHFVPAAFFNIGTPIPGIYRL